MAYNYCCWLLFIPASRCRKMYAPDGNASVMHSTGLDKHCDLSILGPYPFHWWLVPCSFDKFLSMRCQILMHKDGASFVTWLCIEDGLPSVICTESDYDGFWSMHWLFSVRSRSWLQRDTMASGNTWRFEWNVQMFLDEIDDDVICVFVLCFRYNVEPETFPAGILLLFLEFILNLCEISLQDFDFGGHCFLVSLFVPNLVILLCTHLASLSPKWHPRSYHSAFEQYPQPGFVASPIWVVENNCE